MRNIQKRIPCFLVLQLRPNQSIWGRNLSNNPQAVYSNMASERERSLTCKHGGGKGCRIHPTLSPICTLPTPYASRRKLTWEKGEWMGRGRHTHHICEHAQWSWSWGLTSNWHWTTAKWRDRLLLEGAPIRIYIMVVFPIGHVRADTPEVSTLLIN